MNHRLKIIKETLDFAYNKAISDIPGLDSAYDLAKEYSASANMIDNANNLIRWQIDKCATHRYSYEISGFLAIPETMSPDLASVCYIQLRMVAAIAIMGGYDVKSDKVRTLSFSCLVSPSVADIAKQFGLNIREYAANKFFEKIPSKIISNINNRLNLKSLIRPGEIGIVKFVPIIVGLLGGTIDPASTNTIGNIARNVFIEKK